MFGYNDFHITSFEIAEIFPDNNNKRYELQSYDNSNAKLVLKYPMLIKKSTYDKIKEKLSVKNFYQNQRFDYINYWSTITMYDTKMTILELIVNDLSEIQMSTTQYISNWNLHICRQNEQRIFLKGEYWFKYYTMAIHNGWIGL